MKKLFAAVLILTLLLASCSGRDNTERQNFLESESFYDSPGGNDGTSDAGSTSNSSEKSPETEPIKDINTETASPGRLLTAEGVFEQAPVKGLNLRASCRVEMIENSDEAVIFVSLYLDHYEIMIGERAGCHLTVNGEKFKFSAPKIDFSENGVKSSTLLAENSFKLKKSPSEDTFKLDFEALYIFNATYSGEKIDQIIIKDTVELRK